MSKNMLIDAAHAEETRVVVVDGHRVEEFDFESRAKKQLRGNIYLAKVTRVEPSLQAAFVEYGGNRHGFLAFNEIHPDYYQIPVADREALMAEAADEEDEVDEADGEEEEDDELSAEEARLRRRLIRKYKIQEVIKRRQILLVQVVKEERGNKGAALTTYLSLAGRYCVLMPNTGRGGGISRKITNATDRKRLKSVAQSLEVPQGMGLIVRTAGAKRTKQEIKRDYEYLLRLWENIRETTLKSIAPALIYEEEDLVKRAIRDMYDKDIEAVFVDGEDGYREAREFMRMLMPSQAKKIQLYRDPTPLFVRYKVEDVLQQIHSPVVPLRSGGYLVINQTEALVAVDVNSGRATKERNIEATALKTNLEAAEEAARQLRLRDLAGLIVIDFIDMEESKNNRAVEKRLKDALSEDRARIQMGKISSFGLMEISRQRRRTGLLEGTTHVCEHCQGSGRLRSVEFGGAFGAARHRDGGGARRRRGGGPARAHAGGPLYPERKARLPVPRAPGPGPVRPGAGRRFARPRRARDRADRGAGSRARASRGPRPARGRRAISRPRSRRSRIEVEEVEDEAEVEETEELEEADEGAETTGEEFEGAGRRRRRRRRRGRREGGELRAAPAPSPARGEEAEDEEAEEAGRDDEESEEARRRRRRRGRRGGRRMRDEGRPRDPYVWVRARTPNLDQPYVWFDPIETAGGWRAEPAAQPAAETAPRPVIEAPEPVSHAPVAPESRQRSRRGRA